MQFDLFITGERGNQHTQGIQVQADLKTSLIRCFISSFMSSFTIVFKKRQFLSTFFKTIAWAVNKNDVTK